MAGKRCLTARAPRHNFVIFVDKIALISLGEPIPYRFHIIRIVGNIGIIKIQPIAHAVSELLPLINILPNRLFAFGIELINAVLLNLAFGSNIEVFFYFQLHGQTVRVPATLSRHVVALHCLKAGNRVLKHTAF